MSILSLFGLCAVTSAVLFYALESFSPWFILALAIANAMAGIYAFLQGAWPYGLVEIVWTIVGLSRWAPKRRGRLIKLRATNDVRYARGEISRDEYLQRTSNILKRLTST
jgi:uncharacterized membrane protein